MQRYFLLSLLVLVGGVGCSADVEEGDATAAALSDVPDRDDYASTDAVCPRGYVANALVLCVEGFESEVIRGRGDNFCSACVATDRMTDRCDLTNDHRRCIDRTRGGSRVDRIADRLRRDGFTDNEVDEFLRDLALRRDVVRDRHVARADVGEDVERTWRDLAGDRHSDRYLDRDELIARCLDSFDQARCRAVIFGDESDERELRDLRDVERPQRTRDFTVAARCRLAGISPARCRWIVGADRGDEFDSRLRDFDEDTRRDLRCGADEEYRDWARDVERDYERDTDEERDGEWIVDEDRLTDMRVSDR